MTAPIPMVDPSAEYRLLKDEIDAAVGRVLASGRYILGPEGEAFERDIAAYVGAPHAVGCNSGTDALHLPLVAAGIGPGDEVIVPAFTFFATAEAVSYTGARPVFADVDLGTFNLDAASLKKSISSKTKAVIAVHLFGQCAALDEISKIRSDRKALLIEDCAQAIGADYDGRRAGSWGAFGSYSFYPTKNLGAAGDAGLMTTKDKSHDQLLRSLRHHGSKQTYLHDRVGWNSRLDELQAAILRAKFRHLERFIEARRKVAAGYRKRLAGLPLELPAEHGRGRHVYHQFTVRTPKRDALREALARDGIASSVFYPVSLHQQPVYEAANKGLSLPNAEAAAQTVLSLPINPILDEASLDRICARVKDALK
jgi:dTDP-4-amino-4,6-dideoxygalactose transaminase